MKPSPRHLRRLILGMSVEDAQSSFDSPEARRALLLAHQRHNQGVYHELQVAQRQRDKMSPERKCHISRFAKPSVKGFQGYTKSEPNDYVVREIWDTDEVVSSGAAPGDEGIARTLDTTPATATTSVAISPKVSSEKEAFKAKRKLVLDTLSNALHGMKEQMSIELTQRAESGTVATGQQQKPIVDRLIAEVNEGKEKGYRSVSSSSHLLIPVEMSTRLFAKKDQDIADAFKDPLLNFPAREGDISFSLWVAGGLVADPDLIKAYPFQIAKYVVGEDEASPNRLPRASVEVYFSPDLYQMQRAVGSSGIAALRQFVGRIMQKQHEPTPVSTSELLNASKEERALFHTLKDEVIQIPWVQKTKMKISTKTGVVFSEEDSEESATNTAKKEAVAHVWKTWGHLIKDLHVHGDLDFMYVSINRRQEVQDNDDYISEVRQVETGKEAAKSVGTTTASPPALRTTRNIFSLAMKQDKKKRIYVPLSVDVTVVECLLERCGLPHNMVIEDMTNALQELQTQTLEMQRLSVVDELDELKGVDTSEAVAVLYAPKIVVSHAGVIENGTHSYQRIRIRGSSVAHVETLVEALNQADYFTDRSGHVVASSDSSSLELPLPPNLSFRATRSQAASLMRRSSRRLIGHRAGSFSERDGSGRFKPYQESQEFDFLAVSEDERQFWQEHYYKLSKATLIFHDRVDPNDVFSDSIATNPRLKEQVALVQSAVHGGGADPAEPEEGASSPVHKGSRKKKGRKRGKQSKAAANRQHNLAPDAMFQLMCMDMEAEASLFDLSSGDCRGYQYDVKLRKITSQAAPLVRPAMLSLETKGFINYFGSSRFATYTKMNMHPGLHLLKGEFRAAAYVIVQQFYLDAAVTAERMRTGSAFPSVLNMKGAGVHLPDFAKGHSKRSVAEHGTALQRVLNNAIQASFLFQEESNGNATSSLPVIDMQTSPQTALDLSDPCAEAFLKVIGPRACRMLVQEFLSFVWNDVCNQRLQRYGTFSILPGDLVYETSDAIDGASSRSRAAHASPHVTRVTRRDVEQQRYSPHDVLLPIPGAGIQLPDNHTADLYVVALKRMGILFDPEQRQWNLFYPTDLHQDGERELTAPYRMLTPTFTLMEEELSSATPSADPLGNVGDGGNAWVNSAASGAAAADTTGGVDAGHLRQDLRRQGGNALGLYIQGGYRTPLHRPHIQSWALRRGVIGDPYQRWGASLRESRELIDGGDSHSALSSTASGATPHEPLFLQPNPVQVRRRERAAAAAATADSLSPSDVGGATSSSATSTKHTTQPGRQRSRAGAASSAGLRPPRGAAARRPFHRSGMSRVGRALPHPATPYWLPQTNDSCLEVTVTLPSSVYPQSLFRELLKTDVFTPDVVDIDRPLVDSRAKSFEALTADQQSTYRRLLAKRRKQAFQTPPRAISLALLHQQIFRSGGARFSLIPTLRSYDSIPSK